MALTTHDLALALEGLATRGETSATTALEAHELVAVSLASGQRYERDARVAELVLVLEGSGTIAIDDWRATLAGGLVAALPAHKRLVASADAGQRLSLVVIAPNVPAPTSAASLPSSDGAAGTTAPIPSEG